MTNADRREAGGAGREGQRKKAEARNLQCGRRLLLVRGLWLRAKAVSPPAVAGSAMAPKSRWVGQTVGIERVTINDQRYTNKNQSKGTGVRPPGAIPQWRDRQASQPDKRAEAKPWTGKARKSMRKTKRTIWGPQSLGIQGPLSHVKLRQTLEFLSACRTGQQETRIEPPRRQII